MFTPGVLAIDFGAAHTIAMIRRGDGLVAPLLFDGSPLLPAAMSGETVDLVMLGRIRDECVRQLAEPPAMVTLTHPPAWPPTKRLLLSDATGHVGLPNPTLLPAPVAAARYFTEPPRPDLPVGAAVVVADFGAGGYDVSVLTRTPNGFDVLATDGRDDLNGLAGSEPEPGESERAVAVTQAVLRSTTIPAERIAGVFVVGAASRTPLATATIQRAFPTAPPVTDQPELAAAHGAVLAARWAPGTGMPPQPIPGMPPPPLNPATGAQQPWPPSHDKPQRHVVTLALAIVTVIAVVFFAVMAVGNAAGAKPVTTKSNVGVLKDVKTAAAALFSYDYRSFDESIANAKSFATPSFGKTYGKQMEKLRDTVEREEARVEAEVVDVGVSGSKGEAVEVLAFVNQTTKNANIDGSRVDKSRMELTMVPVEGGWKVDDAKSL